jgi:hypothetical protein
MGEPEVKRQLGRPRIRWENNIKMYFKEIGWHGIDLIHLGQARDKWRALWAL